MSFLWWLPAIAFVVASVLASRGLLHAFQLESYQFRGFARTLARTWKRCSLPGICLCVVQLGCALLLRLTGLHIVPALADAVLMVLAGAFLFAAETRRKEKKKLVYTARAKRLLACEGITGILIAVLLGLCSDFAPRGFFLLCFPLALLPFVFALAALMALPIEKGIAELYFQDARHMLRDRPDLICIGITGSYGKTSVKFVLGTLLEEKYQTLITPSSFNTPMGLTKVIRSSLLPSHQVFVAEMGARHVGDIKELCRLVHPTLGAITSIGPQHLDTFRTLERIRDTKYELMEALPPDGCCFFVEDHGVEKTLYEKTKKEKWLISLEKEEGADVWAEQIETGPFGSRFLLCTPSESIPCETKLLGSHNIQNILLAAAICLKLHLTLRQIARGIAKLTAVEHRLQLIERPNGITVIDDAFNANPRGTSAALKVLSAFPQRRIIVTPGMVELGNDEAAFNRTFGEEMAACVDIAILVGPKHTSPIREGLLSRGFPAEQVITVASLEEAAAQLGQIARSGDTVLFENDLPDNYSET